MTGEMLDLSTIVERKTVNIRSKLFPDGKLYELVGQNDLSLYDIAQIEACSRKIALPEKKPTEPEKRAVVKALRDLVKIVLPSIEDKVLLALGEGQLFAIYGTFVAAAEPEEGARGNPRAARTTGG